MDTLPHEMIHHIASYLLPDAKCRLAMTSHTMWNMLNIPIFNWMSKIHAIEVPKYKVINDKISFRVVNESVVYATWLMYLFINNLTQDCCYSDQSRFIYYDDMDCILRDMALYSPRMFMSFNKYVSKNTLAIFMQIRASPLLSLPDHILVKILSLVLYTDRISYPHILRIHPYLGMMYAVNGYRLH